MEKNTGRIIFRIINAILLILISATVILPMMHIFSVSVSSTEFVISCSVGLFPKGFNFDAYTDLLTQTKFHTSLINTVGLTIVYTILALIINTMAAFGFSRPFWGKKTFMYMFVFIMYFSGGLIPTYMVITNTLHLYNNYLAFILPAIVNVFYMIVIRSQIEAVPPSLVDAGAIDGANEFQLLFKIVIPTIQPTLAAIGMFLALYMWNMWYSVLLYSNKESMWTLQYMLRAIVFESVMRQSDSLSAKAAAVDVSESISAYNFQTAAIIIVAAPIVCIYPFLQKYFVKGILVGSVKG